MSNKLPKQARNAGVLLHISSLPSADLGDDAYRFVDFLAETGASIWQTLPLNMPHDDGSPYQCLSAHAGNPNFISLQALVENKLLQQSTLQANKDVAFEETYNQYKQSKNHILQNDFVKFCRENMAWLGDFACFLVLRKKFKHCSWNTWPTPYKNKQPAAIKLLKQRNMHAIGVIKFSQFLFFKQWHALKNYANQKGIAMFGDIPIFVAYDSADVWAKPTFFKLDKRKNMQVVAGVPPDYFSVTGQRWGNPHYNWQTMQLHGFNWWLARMRTQSQLFDLLRIDHFRGLESAWEIPAHTETAIEGAWVLAPGDALLKAIKQKLPHLQLIAEDLGEITDEVNALRTKHNLPGMKILQFAFGGDDTNPYLPHHIDENSVVYTGTHDNNTTLGWWQQQDERTQQHAKSYLSKLPKDLQLEMTSVETTPIETTPVEITPAEISSSEISQCFIALALSTKANMAIIPLQDILGLDGAHRMNTPGTVENNWQWKFDWQQLQAAHISFFKLALKSANRSQL